MSTDQDTRADAEHRAWMRDLLHSAAEYFDVTVAGDPSFGWRDRSIGAPVRAPSVRWLRVVFEQRYWARGDLWSGSADAAAITGIPKPVVRAIHEWDDGPQRIRAEIMTAITERPCSSTPELRNEVELPDQWWADLRYSLDTLATTPTQRVTISQDSVTPRMLAFHGDEIDATVPTWATAHGDLHWANLTAPGLTLLDWEHWGRAPAALDAATLYCYSLLVPDVASKVKATFADILDTPAGRYAQLYVVARLLHRVDTGDHLDLAGPLHRHAMSLRR